MTEAIKNPVAYVETERGPTRKEIALWDRATACAKRVILMSYAMRSLFANLLLTHKYASDNSITLEDPGIASLEMRMNKALTEIALLNEQMDKVKNLEFGVRLSSNGSDLDIVEPASQSLGWVLPAVLGAVVIVGIIVRWAHLESEVSEITAQYNGILRRSDMALCSDKNSEQCKSWETAKKTGGYYRRETIVENIKSAIGTAGTVAKRGFGVGIALAIPLLLWMYAPRRKK